MTKIFIHTRFEALHRWPSAPTEVGFLATLHRHEFHVRAERAVTHEDRQVEFILWKRAIDHLIGQILDTNDCSTWSCERWAREIAFGCDADTVEVSEDGENGAIWSGDHESAQERLL